MGFGERFLRYPDLFPGRPGGEVHGSSTLRLDFPDCSIGVAGLSADQADTLENHFAEVVGPDPGADPTSTELPAPTDLYILRANRADFVDDTEIEFELEFDYQPTATRIAGWRVMARFDWSPTLSAALWVEDDIGRHFPNLIENICRALVAYRLNELGGALIHSSGAADGEIARLFVGHSGAGKTTLWQLMRDDGVTVLGDDLNILSSADGEIVAQSTPFSSMLAQRHGSIVRRPLEAIYFLRQGPGRNLRSISTAEAVGRLIGSTPFINVDPHRREPLFDTLASLCQRVPAFELTSTKEPGLWAWLDQQPSG